MSVLPDEDDFVVVVWANSAVWQGSNEYGGRPFETITKTNSRNPVAWRLSFLRGKYSALLPNAYLIFSNEDLESWMRPPLVGTSSREKPLLVPVKVAREVLGWHDFDTWEDESE